MNVSDEVRFRVSPDIIGNQYEKINTRNKTTNKKKQKDSSNKIQTRKRKPLTSVRFQAVVNTNGLIELDLSKRNLRVLHEEIFTLRRLEVLKADHNQLHGLPREVSSLRQLKKIDCSWNVIAVIPQTLANLKHLKELDLSHNNIHVLPSEITALNNLRVLKLGFNKLNRLPQSFGELSSLRQVELPGNQLWFLPPSFVKLKKLKYLNLGGNKLDQVPISVCNLTTIQGLDLHENDIMNLPQELGQLKRLKELNISGNKLRQLPLIVTQMKQLHSLDISKNQLQNLPAEISRLSKLKLLNAHGNILQSVPQIPSLVYLNVADNRILEMSLSKVKLLKYINASSNDLQNMPLGIYNQKYLEVLKLKDNQINYVSQDIVILQNLKCLDMGNNKLQTIPHVIYDLEKLLSFNMKGNPIDRKMGPLLRQEYSVREENSKENNIKLRSEKIQDVNLEQPVRSATRLHGNVEKHSSHYSQFHMPVSQQYIHDSHIPKHVNDSVAYGYPSSQQTAPPYIYGHEPRRHQRQDYFINGGASSDLHRPGYNKTSHVKSSKSHQFSLDRFNTTVNSEFNQSNRGNVSTLGRMASSAWSRPYTSDHIIVRTPLTSSTPRTSSPSNYSNMATAAESETIGDEISLGDLDFQFQPTNVKDRRLKGVADEVETMLKEQLLKYNY